MIPNQWYAVLESREVKPGRLLGVTRLGEKLVFARDREGNVICLRDRCAHRGAALSLGELCGDLIQCPFHGFQYDCRGRGRLIPANGKNAPVAERFRVVSYPAAEKHGFVFIWWGENPPDDIGEPFFFDDIGEGFRFRTAVDPWSAHYSRAVENQLDVVHLPFVHRDTIGRGNATLVNGPVVEKKGEDHIVVHPYNAVDTGQVPVKAEEIAPPYTSFHVEFHFPNLWQNWIADAVRIVIAFVPVDSEHSLLYLRFYQKFLRLPLLGDLAALMGIPFSLKIAHQDRRIVQTQVPKPSGLGIGENLVQGDGPIAAYRLRRQELIDLARKAATRQAGRADAGASNPRRGRGFRGRTKPPGTARGPRGGREK
jgi:phenylpropionate dioxygenase-like ring-hydroxylating dioxygenase large terminal subunit